jgi:predicted Fe-Mo cluster-binding NifX family protein
MYVLIPVVDSKSKKKEIASGFTSTDYACLYDTDTMVLSWINLAELRAFPGGIVACFRNRNIRFIITSEMKPMALGLFVDNDIVVFQSEGKDLDKNIHLFNENRLFLLNPYLALMKVSCQSKCSNCVTTCKN